MKLITFIFILSVFVSSWAAPQQTQEVVELEKHFADQHVNGTFVLLDPATNQFHIFNNRRAQQRFVPASTFKIANTLIGLEAGAVKSVDDVLPYGGKPQPFKQWEHDMSLRKAIKLSAVPIYQELARRIGLQRMNRAVKDFGYGNEQIGSQIDRFWLEGPLTISAIEQTQFLAKMVQGKLPVSATTVAAVQEITLQERTDDYELHYKTGWVFDTKPEIGWVVGWVNEKDGAFLFALNIDMAGSEDAQKRWPIAKECLKTLGRLQ